jgi:SAM-dependent methyltransferase
MSTRRRSENIFGYRIPCLSDFAGKRYIIDLIRIALAETFRCLEIAPEASAALAERVISALSDRPSGLDLEHDLHTISSAIATPNKLRAALDARARLIAGQIKPHLVGHRLLDLGCGDGMVLQEVDHSGYDIVLADVLNYLDARVAFPFHLLANGRLTNINGSFDTILVLTVLHHADDPSEIVAGLRDLRPKRVIVIESVIEKPLRHGELASRLQNQDFDTRFAFATYADWFYNRVLHQDVPVPYNFGRTGDWKALFSRYGFRSIFTENLGIDQCLVPEVHELSLYEPS